MADLKDDDDLCRYNQLPLASIDSLTAGISLSDLNAQHGLRHNKPLTGGNQSDCLNTSFIGNDDISLRGIGYRGKEENKTPTVGVPAI